MRREEYLPRRSDAAPGSLLTKSPGRPVLLTVYLAGGFHSGWQQRVAIAVPDVHYKDPSKHGLSDPVQYTEWDLQAIRQSDVVFAYLEASNPAGFALSLEVGYAKALGKTVIFVDERSPTDAQVQRQLQMVRTAADAVFDSFAEGVAYLQKVAATHSTA
jgi:hypothetical protein